MDGEYMPNYICVQCGVQFAETETPPEHCPICEDERQYVNWDGQQWTTLEELRRDHKNKVQSEAAGLIGIGTLPSFAIGQRALLVQSALGNVLWDCISLIDDATVQAVRALGGVSAIAVSHPHFYSSIVEWSRAFNNAPIYLHADDRRWVMRPDSAIVFWEGEARILNDGITLVRTGIHFPGGTVLHWAEGAEGHGALLVGDMFQVVMDRRWVSFMCSYPNLIPERREVVVKGVQAVEPFPFERMYGGWWRRNVSSDAKGTLARSRDRYLRQIGGV